MGNIYSLTFSFKIAVLYQIYMAYDLLDLEYIRRVHSPETLVSIDTQARAIISKQTKLKLPSRLGHSIFLFGCFLDPRTIDVQPWAVSEDAHYSADRGRHYHGIRELAEINASGEGNVRLGFSRNAHNLTNVALTGYYWPIEDRIITVFDARNYTPHSDSILEKGMTAALELSMACGVLKDHEIHIGNKML